MKRNLKAFSENYDLSYYTDKSKIPNQELVEQTIWYFEKTDASKVFQPLEFLNLLEKQHEFVLHNFLDKEKVVSHFVSLPLTDHERHILYGFILKWCGGYPTQSLNEDLHATLKLIEKEFLAYPGNTNEKYFCKADRETRMKFMRLSESFNLSYKYGLNMNLVYEALVGKVPEPEVYQNFYELFDDVVKDDSSLIPEDEHDFLILRSRYKIEFNGWLFDTKNWDGLEDENYQQLLTKGNWLNFSQSHGKKASKQISEQPEKTTSWKFDGKNEGDESTSYNTEKAHSNIWLRTKIEDELAPFTKAFNSKNDYQKALAAVEIFFINNGVPQQPIFVKSKNIKKLAFALGEIWRSQTNEVISLEYLQFYIKVFSVFANQIIDERNIFGSNLYKYSISKT
jgi:hypothetical protein